MGKISHYFSTGRITAGWLLALAASLFVYLAWWRHPLPILETLAAVAVFALLPHCDRRVWFGFGLGIGGLWFWWIAMSFLHYGHPWVIPLVVLAVALVYGIYFWLFAWLAERLGGRCLRFGRRLQVTREKSLVIGHWSLGRVRDIIPLNRSVAKQRIPKLLTAHCSLLISSSYPKALALLGMSYVHPFGFDWFKPELILVHTPFGVDKLRFALFLGASFLLGDMILHRRAPRHRLGEGVLVLLLFAATWHPQKVEALPADPTGAVELVSTRVPVEAKWDPANLNGQIDGVLGAIDRAIERNASLVILPESVLPLFLNRHPALLDAIKRRSHRIDIVLGALYYDTKKGVNRNSAWFFHDGNATVADKIVLVPFGETNPLPRWAGKWINRIFFDGAPDYVPASRPTDFTIGGRRWRSAVCYEATSERLYADRPERIVAISNDGWFIPSVEPALQRLLLRYYVRKYGVTVYHSVNMGPSYLLRPVSTAGK
ncbi:apolipoprotein N-acyltransferase [Nitratifractor sp.]